MGALDTSLFSVWWPLRWSRGRSPTVDFLASQARHSMPERSQQVCNGDILGNEHVSGMCDVIDGSCSTVDRFNIFLILQHDHDRLWRCGSCHNWRKEILRGWSNYWRHASFWGKSIPFCVRIPSQTAPLSHCRNVHKLTTRSMFFFQRLRIVASILFKDRYTAWWGVRNLIVHSHRLFGYGMSNMSNLIFNASQVFLFC